jgi:hypothetical protein
MSRGFAAIPLPAPRSVLMRPGGGGAKPVRSMSRIAFPHKPRRALAQALEAPVRKTQNRGQDARFAPGRADMAQAAPSRPRAPKPGSCPFRENETRVPSIAKEQKGRCQGRARPSRRGGAGTTQYRPIDWSRSPGFLADHAKPDREARGRSRMFGRTSVFRRTRRLNTLDRVEGEPLAR